MILRGSELGDIVDRPRCAGLSVAKHLKFIVPLSEFLLTAGSDCSDSIDVDSFFVVSQGELLAEMQEMRARRSCERMVSDAKFWDWTEVLNDSQKERMVKYEELRAAQIRQAKIDPGTVVMYDLDHNPGSFFGRLVVQSAMMPTFIRHGCWWNSVGTLPHIN